MSKSILTCTRKRSRPGEVTEKMARAVELALTTPIYCVKRLEHRIGETINLKDPEDQRRFRAASLARKYRLEHTTLSRIAFITENKALTPKECDEVFKILSGLGKACVQG